MISWKTTTYGRVSTLCETLYSFLNQKDLDDCEMVIVNDYPLQTLHFDHPKVRIFNLSKTFKTIGEKENFAVEMCQGDIIAVADDDDIYLSNHNQNIKKWFKPGDNILHWKGVYYNEPNIDGLIGIGNSGMVYSKLAWDKVGGHPIMNEGGDSIFSGKLHKLVGVVNANVPDGEVSAFYCWARAGMDGIGIYHQSGLGMEEKGRPNIIQRHGEYIESLRKDKKIPTGNITLEPKWKYDYQKLLEDYLNNKNEHNR